MCGHVYRRVHRHVCRAVRRHVCRLCIDMRTDMCTDMCVDMRQRPSFLAQTLVRGNMSQTSIGTSRDNPWFWSDVVGGSTSFRNGFGEASPLGSLRLSEGQNQNGASARSRRVVGDYQVTPIPRG